MDQPVPMRRPLSALAEARLELAVVEEIRPLAALEDVALSACMKLSSSSCHTALWSCGEWIDGLREVLDLKKKRTRYIHE
jgi:hypothetical protein